MSTQSQEQTVETIADSRLWEAVTDGVNTIATGESVFEFRPGEFVTRVKHPSDVVMISQTIDAADFEHYDVSEPFSIGVDTEKFDDLLSVASGDDPVELRYNWGSYVFEFRANGVEYDLAGIDADHVQGSPFDVPGLKDELPYDVRCQMPADQWDRGCDVVELSARDAGQGEFIADGGELFLEGSGDTDKSRVVVSDDPAFEWIDDPPDDRVTTQHSNEFMPDVVSLIDDDTVRFVTGVELPYHVWTLRGDGKVETKFVQAPYIVKE